MTITRENSKEVKARVTARVTNYQKSLLEEAASLRGQGIGEFIIQVASDAAVKLIEQHRILKLTKEDQIAFVEALLNPPKPNARMRAAVRRYKKVLGK